MPAVKDAPQELVVAWQPFSVLVPKIGEVTVVAGQIMRADNPVVQQVPHFFNPTQA